VVYPQDSVSEAQESRGDGALQRHLDVRYSLAGPDEGVGLDEECHVQHLTAMHVLLGARLRPQ
jgi:hypothetical protein